MTEANAAIAGVIVSCMSPTTASLIFACSVLAAHQQLHLVWLTPDPAGGSAGLTSSCQTLSQQGTIKLPSDNMQLREASKVENTNDNNNCNGQMCVLRNMLTSVVLSV